MKQFNAFVKKEFYHIFRDKRTLFILLGMPVMQIIIFGFALTNEVKNSRIAVLDNSKDPATSSLISEIESSRYFDIQTNIYSYKDIENSFRAGKIKLAVVFPRHFNEDLQHFNKVQVQLVADASDPNVASTLTNYASAIIMDYQKRITHDRQLPYTINTEMRMLYNPFCSWCDGNGIDVGLYVDDSHHGGPGKRNGNHGSHACVPNATIEDHCCKGGSLFIVVYCKYHEHFVVKRFCSGSSG